MEMVMSWITLVAWVVAVVCTGLLASFFRLDPDDKGGTLAKLLAVIGLSVLWLVIYYTHSYAHPA